jgi:hypothetical protein
MSMVALDKSRALALPLEIWCKIFTHPMLSRHKHTFLSCSLVCQQWRQVLQDDYTRKQWVYSHYTESLSMRDILVFCIARGWTRVLQMFLAGPHITSDDAGELQRHSRLHHCESRKRAAVNDALVYCLCNLDTPRSDRSLGSFRSCKQQAVSSRRRHRSIRVPGGTQNSHPSLDIISSYEGRSMTWSGSPYMAIPVSASAVSPSGLVDSLLDMYSSEPAVTEEQDRRSGRALTTTPLLETMVSGPRIVDDQKSLASLSLTRCDQDQEAPQGGNTEWKSLSPTIDAKATQLLTITQILLTQGHADIHTLHDFCLRRASRNGNADLVNLLIEYGANVHAKNNEAVALASANGHLSVVMTLIDHGSDPNIALMSACEKGSSKVCKWLLLEHLVSYEDTHDDLTAGPDNDDSGGAAKPFNRHIDVNGEDCAALISAARANNFDILVTLLVCGADATANGSEFPIQYASLQGNVQASRKLIQSGADVGTGLVCAARYAQTPVVQMILNEFGGHLLSQGYQEINEAESLADRRTSHTFSPFSESNHAPRSHNTPSHVARDIEHRSPTYIPFQPTQTNHTGLGHHESVLPLHPVMSALQVTEEASIQGLLLDFQRMHMGRSEITPNGLGLTDAVQREGMSDAHLGASAILYNPDRAYLRSRPPSIFEDLATVWFGGDEFQDQGTLNRILHYIQGHDDNDDTDDTEDAPVAGQHFSRLLRRSAT